MKFFIALLFFLFVFVSDVSVISNALHFRHQNESGKISFQNIHQKEKRLLVLAQQAVRSDKFTNAIKFYKKLEASSDPWYSWAGTSGKVVCYRRMRDFVSAEKITTQIRKERPILAGLMFVWDGDTAALNGDFQKAMLAYKTAEESYGWSFVGRNPVGVLALKQLVRLARQEGEAPLADSYQRLLEEKYQKDDDFITSALATSGSSMSHCLSPHNASDGFQYPIDFNPSNYGNNFLQDATAVPGDYHPGTDLNGYGDDCGQTFYAVADGCVLEVSPDYDNNGILDNWGSVTIQHYYAPYQAEDADATTEYWVSQYAHANAVVDWSANMSINKGDELGTVSDVAADSCHLHFEIRDTDHPDKDNPSAWDASSREEVADYHDDPVSFIDAHHAYGGGIWFDEGAFLYPTAAWTLVDIGSLNDMLYAETDTTRTAYAQAQIRLSQSGSHTLWMFVPWEHGTSTRVPVTLYQDDDWVDQDEISNGTSTIVTEAEVNQYGDDSDSTECGGTLASGEKAGRNCDRWLEVFSAELDADTNYILDISNNTGETGKEISLDMFLLLRDEETGFSGLYSRLYSAIEGDSGTDTDSDGLTDEEESALGTRASDSDSDSDILNDWDEVYVYGTDPNDQDTDDDGIEDWQEVVGTETDPNDTDTDDDGLTDYYELSHWGTDFLDPDADDDGLLDGEEVDNGTSHTDADSDDDGITDGDEVHIYGTNPLDSDSDDDGINDYEDLSFAASTLTAKLTASDGVRDDVFGYSVAISENTAVVGAYNDDDAGTSSGSAYVYRWDGSHWLYEAKLTATNNAYADDRFGYSVAIDGDVIVVGAYYAEADGTPQGSGTAYVFRRNGSTWTQETELYASDAALQDFFGVSVGISGDVIVVGAFFDDNDAGSDAGAAYVFRWDSLTENWDTGTKLTAVYDGSADDQFGYAVSIYGDTAVVGAYADDEGDFSNSGSVYVFRYQGSSWAQEAKLTANDSDSGDSFGISVSVDNDRLLVGTFGAESAYVFQREGTSWTQETKLTGSDGSWSFGLSVSLDGDLGLVGDYDNAGQGAAYLYQKIDSDWYEVAKLTASDGINADVFGISVSLDADLALVGADGASSYAGAAYVYDITDTDNLYPADRDGDGFNSIVEGGDDCDDGDALVYLGATEICDDGIDQDCNAADSSCDADTDGDGLSDTDETAEGSDPNDATSVACVMPTSETDWIITGDCTVFTSKTWSGDLYVQSGAVVTIPSGIFLDMDFSLNKLVVRNGSGVLIEQGGVLNSP